MDQFVEMLKGFGAASPLLLYMWVDKREKREDHKGEVVALRSEISDLKKEIADLTKQLLDLTKDSIKADLTNTMVLEKIADKVGA